jgi:hypothetical protein
MARHQGAVLQHESDPGSRNMLASSTSSQARLRISIANLQASATFSGTGNRKTMGPSFFQRMSIVSRNCFKSASQSRRTFSCVMTRGTRRRNPM